MASRIRVRLFGIKTADVTFTDMTLGIAGQQFVRAAAMTGILVLGVTALAALAATRTSRWVALMLDPMG